MLSVVINTKNAEKTLARTLESVRFADEVLVVDQHSTDRTREIAKHHQTKLFLFDDLGRVEPEARNFALSQATHSWILVIDADEVVSSSLAQKVLQLINNRDDVVGYYLPRKNLIFNAWIKHTGWWPDYQLRLFQKEKACYESGLHGQVKLVGKTRKLPAKAEFAILHHNYPNVSSFIQRMNRYSSVKASELGPDQRSTTISRDLITSFYQEWFRRLFLHQAYLDGGRGVALSFLQSTYELLVELKRWEMTGFVESQKNQTKLVAQSLDQVRGDLSWWLADLKLKQVKGLARLYWRLRRKFRF